MVRGTAHKINIVQLPAKTSIPQYRIDACMVSKTPDAVLLPEKARTNSTHFVVNRVWVMIKFGISRIAGNIQSDNLVRRNCHLPLIPHGDPDRTRTCYLKIRNLALYPDELRGRLGFTEHRYVNIFVYPTKLSIFAANCVANIVVDQACADDVGLVVKLHKINISRLPKTLEFLCEL